MGVILVEIHTGILLNRFLFTFTSPYIWPSKNLQHAQLLVLPDLYNYFVTIYFYFVIFKSRIVIKNEIKFLNQNFVFLPYTHSNTL